MKLQRLLIRYWWFIILLGVAGYFLLHNIAENHQKDREMVFSISETQRISRVLISSGDDQVELQKISDNNWLVNDQSPVSPDAINAFFRVISRLNTAGPVPISVNDSLIDMLRKSEVSVEVFTNNKPLKKYNLGYTNTLNQRSIGVLEKGRKAYRIELPNFDGNVIDLFRANPEYWVGNQIPAPNVESIVAVEVETLINPEESFRIDIFEGGNFRLFNIYKGFEVSTFNRGKVKDFITAITKISYSSIAILTPEERMAVVQSDPDFIHTLYQEDGSKHQLNIYSIPIEEYIDEFGRPVNVDLNRLYVTASGSNQIFIVNYIDIHHILGNLSGFLN
jgi:hypothetical protein